MADSSIVITAGLQIPQSVNTITKDLKQVTDQLNANHALKITANIDLGKSTQRIQSQLATIGKDLKLNVASINAQSIQQSVDASLKNEKITIEPEVQVSKSALKKQVDDLFKELDLEKVYGETGPAKQKLQGLLAEYTKAFKAENFDGAKKSLDEIIALTIKYEKEAENVDQALKRQQDAIRQLVKEANIYVSKDELKELAYLMDNEANARNMLNSLFFTPGVGQRWTDNAWYKDGKTQWNAFVQQLNAEFNATWNNTLNDMDAGKFSEHFAEGVTKLREYLNLEFNIIEEREEDAVLKYESFADRLKAALTKVTGLDVSKTELLGFTDILSDTNTTKIEQSTQKIQTEFQNLSGVLDVINQKKRELEQSQGGTATSSSWIKDAQGNLQGFEVEITKSGGVVEKFKYALSDVEAELQKITGSDKGVQKLAAQAQKEFLKLTSSVNKLESEVGVFSKGISSTFTQDGKEITVTFESLRNNIEGLKNGTTTIESVNAEYTALKGTIDQLNGVLDQSQGKGFNRFANAEISAREFDNTLQRIITDVNSLNEQNPERNRLAAELKQMTATAKELGQEEKNNQWIEKYTELSIRIRQVQNDLKLAKQIERQDNSSIAKKQTEGLNALANAYKKVISLSAQSRSANITPEYKAEIERQIEEYKALMSKIAAPMLSQGIISQDQLNNFIKGYKEVLDLSNRLAEAQAKGAINQKQNAESLKAQTDAIKSAMSELDKIINNTSFGKQKNSLAGMIGDTNTLKDLKSSFEKTVSDAKAAKELYQELLNSLSKDASPTAIANANTQLEQLKSEFDATTTSAKNLQTQLDAIKTFADASKNLLSIDQKSRSSNVTQAQMNQYAAEFEAYNHQITLMEQKLRLEGLYTEQIKKQRNAIVNNTNEIIRQREIQEAQKSYTDEIINKYKELTEVNTRLMSGKAAETETADLKKRNDELKGYLVLLEQELNEKGLLQGEIKKVLDAEKERYETTIKYATEEKARAEAERQENEALKERNQLYSDLTKWVDKYLQSLNAFNNSSIAKKNSGNSNVASQVEENTKLIEQLGKIKASLSQGYDATKLQSLYQEFSKLSDPIKQAVANSAALKQSLLDTGLTQNVSNQIRNLTNQMNNFAMVNGKAVKSLKEMRSGVSFADEWKRISDALKSGKLDDNAIKQLTQDFRNFKGEAQSAGLTVSKFLTSMNSQLRMILQRYISLYAVIGYIRKMVESVKALDTAMINLKRVTDETNTSYEEFLKNANDQARALRTTTSALVEQSYQWAKLGYDINEALELAQTSTIFAKVADIDNSTAVTEMVATMKAFNMTAKEAIDIVDKLDKLNNNYAVSAAGLGQGLERSASALAMTGNSLEQTLAMLTGAGEITQNLENTGNAIKVVSLR